jgi:dTDP-4-amino-4,6-dideoxygalactose transaminase
VINVFQPDLGPAELEALRQVIESRWLGYGARAKAFEKAFAQHIDVPKEEVFSISCCTEGLFQALAVIGLREKDEVILPTISFVGAANAVVSAGARPIFCDVDPQSLNPRLHHIEQSITSNTKALIILHYGGWAVELPEIARFCRDKRIILIEDAANSVASRVGGRACGTFGDIGIWSFDAMKVLVTGDGGMIWCRNTELREIIGRNINLGLTIESGLSSPAETRWWEFDVATFGRRAMLNDVAASLGLVQLERLADFVMRRKAIFNLYIKSLAEVEWIDLPPKYPHEMQSTYYFFWIQCQPDVRDALAKYLRDHGVYTTFRYYPLHLIPVYKNSHSLPLAEHAAQRTLLLPLHQGVSEEDVYLIAELIRRFRVQA